MLWVVYLSSIVYYCGVAFKVVNLVDLVNVECGDGDLLWVSFNCCLDLVSS